MNPYIKGAQLGWKLGHYLTCGQWTYSCKLTNGKNKTGPKKKKKK